MISPIWTCGHCAATIEKAIKAVDACATVACDLPTRSVTAQSGLSAEHLGAILQSA